MLFNSLQFIVFFIGITLWYFQLTSQKGRILLLLLASCYFYMSFIPEYLLIMGAVVVVDYFAAFQIQKHEGLQRKLWLIISLVANIGTLVVFKYYNFFLENIGAALGLSGNASELPFLRIALPIGLSFHTFQAMSYTIEVYRKKQPPEKNFTVYALYVMFYPQLVAGPIERPQNVLPQLKEFRPYNFLNVKEGLSRMMWGFFKKVVIADRLAMIVDHTYANLDTSSSYVYAVGAVMYAMQIYCDFSGYSDIALGAAKVMNINLMENFRQPYLAKNISGFWSRWHISLSSWFRDYVYIPLGGNRKGEARRKLNVFIVFFLSGFWHGANWTFIVWGLLHGLLVILVPGRSDAGLTAAGNEKKLSPASAWIIVNFILVTVLWVFFRSPDIHVAMNYIKTMCSFRGGNNFTGVVTAELALSVLLVIFMLVREAKWPGFQITDNKKFYLYMAVSIVCCYFLGVFKENQFIYFQF